MNIAAKNIFVFAYVIASGLWPIGVFAANQVPGDDRECGKGKEEEKSNKGIAQSRKRKRSESGDIDFWRGRKPRTMEQLWDWYNELDAEGKDGAGAGFFCAGVDVNAKNGLKRTMLMRAVKENAVGCVQALLEQKDIEVNAKDLCGDTALMEAASYGHMECLKLLLKRKDVCVNEKNNNGNTALSLAAQFGYDNCVKKLLEDKRLDFNAIIFKHNRTFLHWAVDNNRIAYVCWILKLDGIDVNVEDFLRDTPLFIAAMYGYEVCLELLLCSKGFGDINARSFFGETALMRAASNNKDTCVGILLEYGADPASLSELSQSSKLSTKQ